LAGRWFIWQNIFSNISTVPVNGFGHNSFKETYSGWQSQYFQANSEWGRYHWVADSPSFAFNEFLHYHTEFGIAAALLLTSALIFNIHLLFKKSKGYEQCLVVSNLVILFFGMISYPLHSIWVLALFTFNHISIIIFHWLRKLYVLVSLITAITLLALSFLFYFKHEKAITVWQEASMIPVNYPDEKSAAYRKAAENLSKNQYFLNDYCLFYLYRQNPDSTIQLAAKNRRHMNQYEYSMAMGEAYLQKRNYDSARVYFLKANSIIPNRFIPLLQLMEIEIEANNYDKASEFARKITDMPVKIPSAKIDLFKVRANEVLK
jgi:tetratricopeptide (TPR) repeat protein